MEGVASWIIGTAYGALGLAFALALLRLMLGPSLADRVVAVDMAAFVFIGFAGLYGVETGYPGLLNVALAVAVFVFLATVAYARYQESVAALAEEEGV